MSKTTAVALRRTLAALLGAVACLVTLAISAAAHDPIFIDDDQTTPDVGPYMPDGAISWALYGQVLADGETRGFEFDLRDGDELYISLLIPNLAPELDLADELLPALELTAPDGTVTTFENNLRVVFDEPFSNTSYVTLMEFREPAQAGRYRGIVIGAGPSRFTVAIGEQEIFFTDTERSGDRPTNFLEITEPLNAWYSTPPGAEPVASTGDDEAAIDIDMIEDAMESGVGQISEGGSLTGEDDETEPGESAGVDTDERAADERAAEEVGAEEPAEVDDPVGAADSSAADAIDESAQPEEPGEPDEVAGVSVEATDDDASTTWIAPVVVIALAAAVGAWLLMRRNVELNVELVETATRTDEEDGR